MTYIVEVDMNRRLTPSEKEGIRSAFIDGWISANSYRFEGKVLGPEWDVTSDGTDRRYTTMIFETEDDSRELTNELSVYIENNFLNAHPVSARTTEKSLGGA